MTQNKPYHNCNDHMEKKELQLTPDQSYESNYCPKCDRYFLGNQKFTETALLERLVGA